MKIKLRKLQYLNLTISDYNKSRISSLYIRECAKINNINLIRDIFSLNNNVLERINVDNINVAEGDFETINKISNLGGVNDIGVNLPTPQIYGEYTIKEWILDSQKSALEEKLPNTLTLRCDHVAIDNGKLFIHFTEETPPDITDLFNFNKANKPLDEFNTIYVGDGSSYYHDLKIKEEYCKNWGSSYSNKIDLWFVHEKEGLLPPNYKYSPYLLSDGINFIRPGEFYLGPNISSFLIDVSFVLKSNGNYSLYGNKDSGFYGDEDGLKFTVGDFVYFLENNSDFLTSDTETLYELKNNRLYKNSKTIPSSSNINLNNITSGLVTLFGDSNSVFVGKIYYIQIINSNSSIELIPCYDYSSSSNPIAGLYDITNQRFYGEGSNFWCPTNENDNAIKRYLSFDIEDIDRIKAENGDLIIV